MGRITNSFRIKLDEAVARLKSELYSLLVDKNRRRAFEKVVKSWYEEANAIGAFSQPYIYGSLAIFSAIDLQAQIDELRREIKELRMKVNGGRLDNRPEDKE